MGGRLMDQQLLLIAGPKSRAGGEGGADVSVIRALHGPPIHRRARCEDPESWCMVGRDARTADPSLLGNPWVGDHGDALAFLSSHLR
jgi:hypothetical protein